MDAWWREIVTHAGTFMSERDWSFAFSANGLTGPSSHVSAYIRQQLEWVTCPARREGAPTVESLSTALSIGRRLSWTLVLPPSPAPRAVEQPLTPPTAASARSFARDLQQEPDSVAAAEAQAVPPTPGGWRIPRAMRLPPLPPPASPPPPSPTTGSQGQGQRPLQSTQPAVTELSATPPPPKRRRSMEEMSATASSSTGVPERVSARTRSRSSVHNTNT